MRFTTIAVLAALLVAGCSSDSESLRCPDAAVLAPTSILTVFRDGAPADPSGELYSVWMSNVTTDCDYDKNSRSTNSTVTIFFHAKRAPSAEAASYTVPYFMTTTEDGAQVLAKRIYYITFTFAPGQTHVPFSATIDNNVVRIGRGKKIGAYEILAGMQLTHQQLEYNQKMNNYAP